MPSVLDVCRENFGRPPRQFRFFERMDLTIRRCHISLLWDPLKVHYKQQKIVQTEGQIVWGHLVQANSSLFDKGPNDCPADVIYSFDPFFDDRLDALAEIAEAVSELKGTEPNEPGQLEVARHLTDEYTRIFKHPVPPEMTGGREVFLTSLMVIRKHLPGYYLQNGYFPLVACPDMTPALLILPARYWPKALIAAWES